MGYFYVDESIHDEAGFIIAAFVYSEKDLSPMVSNILKDLGFKPGIDEFKSCTKMHGNEKRKCLRKEVEALASVSRIAFVVIPRELRSNLGAEILSAVEKIIKRNELDGIHHNVYIDEGIKPKSSDGKIESRDSLRNSIHWQQNSKCVCGIQVADCVASYFSTMLKEQMGLVTKSTTFGEESGFDEGSEISIGWELWAQLRYSIFVESKTEEIELTDSDKEIDATFIAWNYGVFVSDDCDQKLVEDVKNRFGINYLGCLH